MGDSPSSLEIFHGISWKYMVLHVLFCLLTIPWFRTWSSMFKTWNSKVLHAFPLNKAWKNMDRMSSKSTMELHGTPCLLHGLFHGKTWSTMELHVCKPKSIIKHGAPWFSCFSMVYFMEKHGANMEWALFHVLPFRSASCVAQSLLSIPAYLFLFLLFLLFCSIYLFSVLVWYMNITLPVESLKFVSSMESK